MNSQEEKGQLSRSNPINDPESPFLDKELFVKEAEPELEARLAALEAESSFQNAFDQAQTSKNEQELEEEFATEEWILNLPRLDLLPCKLPYDCQEKLKRTSVAVVGGGLAGLMAALQLCRCGVKVTVFEARSQVGGRVQSNIKWSNGRIIEEGAELIGSFHTTWLRLAREYGLACISRMDENLYEREGLAVKLRLLNKDKDLSMDEICDLRKKMDEVLWQISKEASNIQDPSRPWIKDPSRPWLQPRLRQFDCMSVAEALAIIYRVEPNGLLWKILEHKLVNDEVAPLEEMNFLGLLCKVRAGQDVQFCGDDTDLKECLPKGCLLKEPKECLQKERLMRYWNELEIFRCADGCETLAKMMAKEIQTMGSSISPKTAVTSIKLSTQGVEIESRNVIDEKKERLAGKPNPPTKYDYVILAIPPSVWGRVNIKVNDQVVHPPRMDMNGAVKHFSDVKKRFWIKENPPAAPSGGSLTLGQIWEGTDNQTRIPDSKQGIVLSVFAGPILPGGLVPAQDQIEKELKRLYPNYTRNLNKSSFKNWPEEPFIKTGYASPAKRQIFEIGEKLSRPFYDRLFFAGEHTHMAFFGYMEGALRSGERAANMLMQKKCGLYKELDPVTPPSCPPLMVASSAPTRTKTTSEYEFEIPSEEHSATDYPGKAEFPFFDGDFFASDADIASELLAGPQEYAKLTDRKLPLQIPEGVEQSGEIEKPDMFGEAEDGFVEDFEEEVAYDEFENYAEASYEDIDHEMVMEVENPFYEMENDEGPTEIEEELENDFSQSAPLFPTKPAGSVKSPPSLPVPLFPPKPADPLTTDDKMKLALENAIEDAIHSPIFRGYNLNNFPVRFTIVDITDASGPLPSAGFNENHTDYIGSEVKVAVMYSAYALQDMVKRFAASTGANSTNLFFWLARHMNPSIIKASDRIARSFLRDVHRVPSYQNVFALKPAPPIGLRVTVTFAPGFDRALERMIVQSDNDEAANCIHGIGYGYLNGALEAGGFFHPSNGQGLWVGGDFFKEKKWPYVRIVSRNDGFVAQAGTTRDMAKLVSLIMTNRLLDPASCSEMQGKLARAATTGIEPWLKQTRIFRRGTITHNKVGYGLLKSGKLVFSDISVYQSPVVTGRRYVVAWQNLPGPVAVPSPTFFVGVAKIIKDTIAEYERQGGLPASPTMKSIPPSPPP